MTKRLSAFLRLALASLGLIVCITAASADYVITHDTGGDVRAYAAKFVSLRDAGENIVIDGSCRSACTLVISIFPRSRVCATPKAVLSFHASTHQGTGVIYPDGSKFLLSTYPPEIQKWLVANKALERIEATNLSGSELEKFVKPCAPKTYSTSSTGTTGQAVRN